MRPRIIVRRYPYEEPHHLHLEMRVSNGRFAAQTDFYCNRDDLQTIGAALTQFPRSGSDEFRWEYGSEDPADRFYRYVLLRAFMFDKTRCALQFKINQNEDSPKEGLAQFSIAAEPAAINRLGTLFMRFYALQHLEFEWDDRDDQLFKDRQADSSPEP